MNTFIAWEERWGICLGSEHRNTKILHQKEVNCRFWLNLSDTHLFTKYIMYAYHQDKCTCKYAHQVVFPMRTIYQNDNKWTWTPYTRTVSGTSFVRWWWFYTCPFTLCESSRSNIEMIGWWIPKLRTWDLRNQSCGEGEHRYEFSGDGYLRN